MARNEKEESIHIGFREALALILPYFQKKIWAQFRSVIWIVLYLTLFQLLVLRIPIREAGLITLGIAAVILGLTFFLEGLFLGLMPLGEALGLRLPQKLGIISIMVFSLLLGMGATLAEPAIAILKACGSKVAPWDAPLLYYLLNEGTDTLYLSIAIGVGFSVILGMLRFLYGFSLSKVLVPSIFILLGVSIYAYFDENLRYISGLAWDSGAVTTGPVTVPLVVALGIGISKVSEKNEQSSAFGVVTLASLFPILSVFIVGIYFSNLVPRPMAEGEFLRNGIHTPQGKFLLGEKLNQFEQKNQQTNSQNLTQTESKEISKKIIDAFVFALRAILPLSVFLILFLYLVLKEKIPYPEEVRLGIIFAVIGLTIFNFGIMFGLNHLGDQVGGKLPSTFRSIELTDSTKYIKNFNPKSVYTALNEDGKEEKFFYLKERKLYTGIPYREENWNPKNKVYEYIPIHGPIFGKEDNLLGFVIVLAFAFVLGYSATLAEPALSALGNAVEETTVGTFRKSLLIQSVAIGVGFGTLIGMLKIILEIPIVWILVPVYFLLLILNTLSKSEFIEIAWDSAGVTTGPITVPLVIAMGLGIGNQLGTIDGFGILACASAFPILTVLIMGILVEKSRKLSLNDSEQKTK
jgi:MFS family permease